MSQAEYEFVQRYKALASDAKNHEEIMKEKQTDMEMALVSIKGVVSFTIDVIHQRCTVRYMNHITPKLIVENVAAKAHLEAKLIVRNKLNQEVLMSVSNNDDDTKSNLLPYLSEEHSPVKDKAVSMFGEFQSNASGIFKWFQESFYW